MRVIPIAIAALIGLGVAAPAASAESLDGSWYHRQGQIDVVRVGDEYVGTVVTRIYLNGCWFAPGTEVWRFTALTETRATGTALRKEYGCTHVGKATFRVHLRQRTYGGRVSRFWCLGQASKLDIRGHGPHSRNYCLRRRPI